MKIRITVATLVFGFGLFALPFALAQDSVPPADAKPADSMPASPKASDSKASDSKTPAGKAAETAPTQTEAIPDAIPMKDSVDVKTGDRKSVV